MAAYRVEGVNSMYIGAGNPLGLLRQTGRWVNQNMSLNIIPLIEPLTEPSNRATELATHRSRWLPISPIAHNSAICSIVQPAASIPPMGAPIEQQLEFCRQNGNQRLSALQGSPSQVSAFFYPLVQIGITWNILCFHLKMKTKQGSNS